MKFLLALAYLLNTMFYATNSQLLPKLQNSNSGLSKFNQCFSCRQYGVFDHPTIPNKQAEQIFASCNRTTQKCYSKNDICGIEFDNPSNNLAYMIHFGCVSIDRCEKHALSDIDRISFENKLIATECCDGDLCNTKENSPRMLKLLTNDVSTEADENNACPGYPFNHRKLLMKEKNKNIASIKDGENLLITHSKLDHDYMNKYSVASFWYFVPNNNKNATFLLANITAANDQKSVYPNDKLNITKNNKIFYISANDAYICNFTKDDSGVMINKKFIGKKVDTNLGRFLLIRTFFLGLNSNYNSLFAALQTQYVTNKQNSKSTPKITIATEQAPDADIYKIHKLLDHTNHNNKTNHAASSVNNHNMVLISLFALLNSCYFLR